jgi:membrane-associated protease RseP (regulator of RpoE activity)
MVIFSAFSMLAGAPDPAAPWRLSSVLPTIGGSVAPAASAGLEPGDLIVRIGDVRTPDSEQISELFLASIGTPVAVVVQRGDEELSFDITPTKVVEDGVTKGRIGVTIEPSHLVTPGVGEALGDGAAEVWALTGESVGNLGRAFGPEGIGRTFSLLFSNAPRPTAGSAESVVGIGRRFGTYGERGQWVEFLYLFGYVTLFIGLVNLVPLPPLDGGHVAVLAIEKVRGRRVDMRKLIPVSAVVLSFLVLFTLATVALDIFKPVSIGP